MSDDAQEETISFEFLRNVQRQEYAETKLTGLPPNFYNKSMNYLDQKREILKKKPDMRTSLEINNIQRLLEDIFNRRETKITNHAIITGRTGIPPQNLTEEEESFFNQIVNLLKSRREKSLSLIFEKTKEKGFQALKFKEDVPEFVGPDLKKYGPFSKDIKADIPIENAKLLIKMNKAEKCD